MIHLARSFPAAGAARSIIGRERRERGGGRPPGKALPRMGPRARLAPTSLPRAERGQGVPLAARLDTRGPPRVARALRLAVPDIAVIASEDARREIDSYRSRSSESAGLECRLGRALFPLFPGDDLAHGGGCSPQTVNVLLARIANIVLPAQADCRSVCARRKVDNDGRPNLVVFGMQSVAVAPLSLTVSERKPCQN